MENKKRPVLSISMLVSGQRKDTFQKCIASLQPLREAIPCELVLVDTGCEEEEKAYLRDVADLVVPFTWCRDFSAARNAGLRECRGEWFLYIDDDEWFEDTSELIAFFQTGEYKKYEAGWYLQRNYDDFEGTSHTDCFAGRMQRLLPDTRFIGKIHEFLSPLPTNVYRFSTFVHHYGYVYKSEEERREHLLRNLTLEEEAVAENPDDIRMCCQLVQEYRAANCYEKAEKLCLETLQRTKYGKENSFVQYLISVYPRILGEEGRDKEAIAEYERLEGEAGLYPMTRLSVLYEEGFCLVRNHREEEALECFLRYLAAYEEKDEGEQGFEVMDFAEYTSAFSQQKVLGRACGAMLRTGLFGSAKRLFSLIDWKKAGHNAVNFLEVMMQMAEMGATDISLANEIYCMAQKGGLTRETDCVLKAAYYNREIIRKELCDAAAALGEDRYFPGNGTVFCGFLYALWLKDELRTGRSLKKEASRYYEEAEQKKDAFLESIFLENDEAFEVMRTHVDLEELDQVTSEALSLKTTEETVDFLNLFLKREAWPCEDSAIWYGLPASRAAEAILLEVSETAKEELSEETKELLTGALEEFVLQECALCSRLYQPSVCEKNRKLLPKRSQFAYAVSDACAGEKTMLEWAKELTEATKLYPRMVLTVKQLISIREGAEKVQEEARAAEMKKLSKQLKAAVKQALTEGKTMEAEELLKEAKKILPEEDWSAEALA